MFRLKKGSQYLKFDFLYDFDCSRVVLSPEFIKMKLKCQCLRLFLSQVSVSDSGSQGTPLISKTITHLNVQTEGK